MTGNSESESALSSGSKKIVFPGKEIAICEEAEASAGAVEENGIVYASVVGLEKLRAGTAGVSNPSSPRMLQKGDLVYGQVEDLFDQVALLGFKPAEKRVSSNADRAFLRIGEVQGRGRGYTESFKDVLRMGDLVKARVIEVTELGVYVTIAEADLGVIKAYCTSCRHELGESLECPNCLKKERRKMAK